LTINSVDDIRKICFRPFKPWQKCFA